ncbi:MAG TPA: PEGA domain-containing protein [Spirochaetales bacterium]|nr:PEGA domain-containing protein [Spirochaetales bacterium]
MDPNKEPDIEENFMKHAINRTLMAIISSILVLVLLGCATIIKGDKEPVYLSSKPDSAEVYVNGVFAGITPIRLNLTSKGTYTIEFRKEGYRSKVVQIDNQIGAGWIVLDALVGLVPILVDAITGSWYDLTTNNVNAVLEQQLIL